MAKDETEIGITGQPIPKKKRSPKKQYEFEKKRRENLGQNVGGLTYRSDTTPYLNPRSVREEVLVDYLLDEGFASDEKSAQAIAGAMSEEWVQSIVDDIDEGYKKLPVGKMMRKVSSTAYKRGRQNERDPDHKETGRGTFGNIARMGVVAQEHDPEASKEKERQNRIRGGQR